ncbi:MAG: hypothetical protein FRX48_01475 [Lasallia pustulata]|uniref:Myb-like domain-containing protein n=1 Tax=Lasallia pustulata TaxID=136370 RepID=A0A5M8Q030_9LECA|nr:MAG: hypothetical protein FRX48_01475 [Lasallia pustulata]
MSVIDSPSESPAPARVLEMPAGSGSAAKNSNHWSVEAREDMFTRRASGEGWETICKDYPNRTRHAMQQQYSMMKKQRDMDNGTFVPRQRGRKSKVAPRRSWTSVNKHQVTSEEEEELELGDEDEDDVNEDESVVVEEDERLIQNHQPSKPANSAKHPSLQPSMKSSLFPNLLMSSRSRDMPPLPQVDPSEASNKSSAEREGTGSEFRSSPHPNKRRKYSTEPSETSEYPNHPQDFTSYPKSQPDNASTPEMIWSSEDVAALQEVLTKTRAKARSTSITLTAERESRQATYEAALGRANRRAHAAEENLRDVTADYGDHIRATQAALSKAEKEYNELRRVHADSSKANADEIAALRSELQAASEQIKDTAVVNGVQEKLGEMQTQIAELQRKDTTKEGQLKLYDQLRDGITKEVHTLQLSQESSRQNSAALEAAFQTLSISITDLNNTMEDLPAKKIGEYVRKIQDEKEGVTKALEIARESWTKTSEVVSAFGAQFAAESSTDGAKEAQIDETDLNVVD